jgi:hypothetical protein
MARDKKIKGLFGIEVLAWGKLHRFMLVYTIHLPVKNMELYRELFHYNGFKMSA